MSQSRSGAKDARLPNAVDLYPGEKLLPPAAGMEHPRNATHDGGTEQAEVLHGMPNSKKLKEKEPILDRKSVSHFRRVGPQPLV
jgi:hypothetical protein